MKKVNRNNLLSLYKARALDVNKHENSEMTYSAWAIEWNPYLGYMEIVGGRYMQNVGGQLRNRHPCRFFLLFFSLCRFLNNAAKWPSPSTWRAIIAFRETPMNYALLEEKRSNAWMKMATRGVPWAVTGKTGFINGEKQRWILRGMIKPCWTNNLWIYFSEKNWTLHPIWQP